MDSDHRAFNSGNSERDSGREGESVQGLSDGPGKRSRSEVEPTAKSFKNDVQRRAFSFSMGRIQGLAAGSRLQGIWVIVFN